MPMRAKDVMTQPVISVEPDDTIERAIRLMLQKRISGLPVINAAGHLVGIVTEGDFLRRSETGTQHRRPRWLEFLVGPGRLASEYVRTHGRKVNDVMTEEPITVEEDVPLEDIVKLMEKHHIKRMPVVRGDKVVGILSRANLLHALATLSLETRAPTSSDEIIRDQLLAALKKENWAPLGTVDIIVRDGVVHLWGTIFDERERGALIVAAENIPGTKSVCDELTWIDPVSGSVLLPPGEDEREHVPS